MGCRLIAVAVVAGVWPWARIDRIMTQRVVIEIGQSGERSPAQLMTVYRTIVEGLHNAGARELRE